MEGPGSAKIKKKCFLSTVHAFKTLQKVFSSAIIRVQCNDFLCLCILFSRPFKLPRPVLELNDLTPIPSSVARSAECLARIEASPRVMTTFSTFFS